MGYYQGCSLLTVLYIISFFIPPPLFVFCSIFTFRLGGGARAQCFPPMATPLCMMMKHSEKGQRPFTHSLNDVIRIPKAALSRNLVINCSSLFPQKQSTLIQMASITRIIMSILVYIRHEQHLSSFNNYPALGIMGVRKLHVGHPCYQLLLSCNDCCDCLMQEFKEIE